MDWFLCFFLCKLFNCLNKLLFFLIVKFFFLFFRLEYLVRKIWVFFDMGWVVCFFMKDMFVIFIVVWGFCGDLCWVVMVYLLNGFVIFIVGFRSFCLVFVVFSCFIFFVIFCFGVLYKFCFFDCVLFFNILIWCFIIFVFCIVFFW